MARWAPRDGLGLEGQRDRHGDSARLPPKVPALFKAVPRGGHRKGEGVIGAMTRHEILVLGQAGVPGARVATQTQVSERSVGSAWSSCAGCRRADARGASVPSTKGGRVGGVGHRVHRPALQRRGRWFPLPSGRSAPRSLPRPVGVIRSCP